MGNGEQQSFTHVAPGTSAGVWRRHPAWSTGETLSLAGVHRMVVVAAHPDDESLGAGGLVATATRLGLEVHIVCATDGEGSHPGSPTMTPKALASLRVQEGRRAARELGVEAVQRLELPDGGVEGHRDEVTQSLVDLVGDGRGALLVSPWRRDGHPDHEAVGHASAAAALRTRAELWEYPIWFWHWARPEQAPWASLCSFETDDTALRAKCRAIRAHASQVSALSPLAGDETLLPPELLAHFESGPEHYLRTRPDDQVGPVTPEA